MANHNSKIEAVEEKAKKKVEEAQQETKKAKDDLEKANKDADKAKQDLEKAKQDAEKAKYDTEKVKQEAEKAKQIAEKAKQEAEKAKQEAEKEAEKRKIEEQKTKQKLLEIQQKNESIKKKNEDDINTFRENQNIFYFLELIQRFENENTYLVNTLDALNEFKIITNYKDFKAASQGKIEIIRKTIYEDNKLKPECQRRLIIVLLCNEKNNGKCDKLFENLVNKGSEKKELLFDVLLDYGAFFGEDVHFRDIKIYEEFVEYSLNNNNKYKYTLDYRSNDLIQLKILLNKINKIFDLGNKVEFSKLNDYSNSYELIENIIKYEKEKRTKFIVFPKSFWEKFSIYYKNNEKEDIIIQKLFELYKLLLSYTDLGKDNSDYKDILAADIHKIIEDKLVNINHVKDQLQLLFELDPYYAYASNKRNPDIFKNINIFNLKEEQDIKYFRNLNLEKVYINNFNNFLDVIIGKINVINDFDSLIKIFEIHEENNKKEYISRLIKRYSGFSEEEMTEESFINLLKKVKEYTP